MTRRLVATYLVITAFGLALLGIPLGITFAHHEKDLVRAAVARDADTMAALVEDSLENGRPVPSADINRYTKNTGGRVIVVNSRGIAVLDTENPQHPGLDYSTRPEIKAALSGKRVDGTRHSNTLGTTLVYAAVPTTANGRVTGAVRIIYLAGTLDARVHRAWAQLALECLGVLITVALVGYVIAQWILRPIRRLEEATERFAAGDLTARAPGGASPS